jgi:PDZ domain
MKRSKYLAAAVLGAALCLAGAFAAAQDLGGSAGSSAQPRSAEPPLPPPPVESQGSNGSTLEIAPQPGALAPRGSANVIPGGRSFRPGEGTASIPRPFSPGAEEGGGSRPAGRPYLGITVRYRKMCYLGKEEHGLEIVKVDPNSPAAAAGLRGATQPGVLGTSAATFDALVPLLGSLMDSQLNKRGELGMSGDMIVAVDDHRVRSDADFDAKIAKLKPGDTMYVTVLRPIKGGGHKTLKIAVKVGEWNQPVASGAGNP